MAEFTFEVTVRTDFTQLPEDERTEQQFARDSLWCMGQVHAENTDGWADCVGAAYIMDVNEL